MQNWINEIFKEFICTYYFIVHKYTIKYDFCILLSYYLVEVNKK